MRTTIIAVLYMALSAQALAWTAMPCCAGADAGPSVTHGMNDDMSPDMADGDTVCAHNGSDRDTDHATSNCCPGAVCSSVSAILSPSISLGAQGMQTDISAVVAALPSTPPEQLLRPPIA